MFKRNKNKNVKIERVEKQPNKIRFEFIDNTHKNRFNETTIMEKQWFGEINDGQVLDLETYYYICKEFALAMGYCEKSIDEWFGEG